MASGGRDDLKYFFDKYAGFGKTEAQLKKKNIRIDSRNIQKLMKDGDIIDSKYTISSLNSDIARTLDKLTSSGTYAERTKTFELDGFKLLINQIAESKKISTDQIVQQLKSKCVSILDTAYQSIIDCESVEQFFRQ